MDTKMTMCCAAECAQILDDTGRMFVECIKDPKTGVMHVYVYAQENVTIVPHIKGKYAPCKCGDAAIVPE